MGEPTMEEYMMKTQEDYGLGIVWPNFDDKAHFELKGQFLKERRNNTFSGSDNEDANEHLEKALKIIDLFHILDVTKNQIMLRVFPMSLTKPTSTRARSTDTFDGLAVSQAQLNNLEREIKKVNERVYAAQVGCKSCGGPHYTKDYPLKEEGKTLKEAYYTQFRVPLPQGGRYRATALGFYQRDNGNLSYQEQRQTMEESLSKFMAKSAKRHDENSNLIKEIRIATDAAIRNQRASIKALEIQIGQMGKVLQEKGSGSLLSVTETNPRDHVKSISTTVETGTPSICHIEPVRYAISSPQNRMQFFKPNQTVIPFPGRSIDDCYEEKEALKSLLMNKPRMGYQIEASMNVHDSAILEDSLPLKEKDPGSFTIPCYINNICFEKALADLGASVSVMPYSTYTNLGLGELAPTKLIVELADKIVKRPKDIAKTY
ncbi:hypothetical protein Tco_0748175 [Tanacetum coccineum]|uniref:Uncharacterized protein n=1 Tax=Tanacetum coccineum TaxID=301880 RepID=A0ABQ4YUW1_9ASTR